MALKLVKQTDEERAKSCCFGCHYINKDVTECPRESGMGFSCKVRVSGIKDSYIWKEESEDKKEKAKLKREWILGVLRESLPKSKIEEVLGKEYSNEIHQLWIKRGDISWFNAFAIWLHETLGKTER